MKKHLIKAVGDPNERFHEDALRMMRAVRFASKLDFVISTETLQGIKNNAPLLEKIAVERIRVEFEKLLMGQNPVAGLRDFIETGLYQYCPELKEQKQKLSGLLLLNNWQIENVEQAWAVIAIQLGMDTRGVSGFLKKWKTSNNLIVDVKKTLPVIHGLHNQKLEPMTLFNAGEKAVKDANQVAKLYGWAVPDRKLKDKYDSLPIKTKNDLAVNGGILMKEAGIKPGPLLGKILNMLVNQVVNGELANTQSALVEEAKRIEKEG